MEEIKEFNWKFLFIIIGIVFLIIIALPWNNIFPKQKVENKTIIVERIKYINILVTPTPDYITIFPNEYENGTRLLQHPFSWYRENVSGLKNMHVSINVYNWLMFDKINTFNPTDYKYYTVYPNNTKNKFLFVFVYAKMDDIIGDDPRMWLPTSKQFGAQIGDRVYYPIDYPKYIRIKELEFTFNYNDDSRVIGYGQRPMYSSSTEQLSSAGEYSEEHYYLRGGNSNQEDGFIIFEIPRETEIEDVTILGSFFSFGNSQWILKQEK